MLLLVPTCVSNDSNLDHKEYKVLKRLKRQNSALIKILFHQACWNNDRFLGLSINFYPILETISGKCIAVGVEWI
jgi:hypothetical protein